MRLEHHVVVGCGLHDAFVPCHVARHSEAVAGNVDVVGKHGVLSQRGVVAKVGTAEDVEVFHEVPVQRVVVDVVVRADEVRLAIDHLKDGFQFVDVGHHQFLHAIVVQVLHAVVVCLFHSVGRLVDALEYVLEICAVDVLLREGVGAALSQGWQQQGQQQG